MNTDGRIYKTIVVSKPDGSLYNEIAHLKN